MELYLPNQYFYNYRTNRSKRAYTKVDSNLTFSTLIKRNAIISSL